MLKSCAFENEIVEPGWDMFTSLSASCTVPYSHDHTIHTILRVEGLQKRNKRGRGFLVLSDWQAKRLQSHQEQHNEYPSFRVSFLCHHSRLLQENSDRVLPFLRPNAMIPFRCSVAMNLRVSSWSRTKTGGSPKGARTSIVLPMWCGLATSAMVLTIKRE